MAHELFGNAEAFRDRFEQGLIDLLRSTGELGEDILVLANANFEPRIWRHLRDELRSCFDRLATELASADRGGRTFPAAPDDIATLRQILDHGFDCLGAVESRRAGPWELQLNPLRGWRPARHSKERTTGIQAPFDEGRFHFDKPFLRQEIIWAGRLLGRDATIFYNKFPFADYQGMLVPDLAQHQPQFLEPADIDYLCALAQELQEHMPGFGLAYNSYGAHASVNHLHFHTFLREQPLPLEDRRWRHNGGAEPYPCTCLRFTGSHELREYIEELHRNATSYNLILTSGRLYCLPRRRQGEYATSTWLGALAWFEMAGAFPLTNGPTFARLDAETIAMQLRQADISGKEPGRQDDQ